MKKDLLILSAVVGSACAVTHRVKDVRGNLGSDRVIEVSLGGEGHKLLADYGADQLGVNKDSATAKFRVVEEELNLLENFGHEFEDFTEEFIQLHEDRFNGLHEDFRFCTEGAACAKREAQDFYAEYQPLESLWARMEDLVESSPIAEIGSIGESYEGRDQKTVVIENPIGKKEKPLVFYFCNIHAREWLTPMYCMHMAETLLTGGKFGLPHYLTFFYDFTILVSANPDGYSYTWTDENLWRKTRMPNNGTDCVGTDPNRNWGVNHKGPGSSADPCSQTYHGIDPFDQVETANIAAYILENQDRLITYNDVHSYSYMWMCPYAGYYDAPPQEDYDQMMICSEAAVDAIEEVSGDRWAFGTVSHVIYIAAGGSVDWVYREAGVLYSYTVELRGTEFQPNSTNIIPSNAEMFAGMEASLICIAEQEFGITLPDGDEGPTPPPTSYPTSGCKDLVPSGIVYGDGSPAPCTELGPFCADFDFVRDRCPITCDSCPEGPPDLLLANLDTTAQYVLDVQRVKQGKKGGNGVKIAAGAVLVSAVVGAMMTMKFRSQATE
eukprot:augustus_masked-scaffold_10-processed-gene-8.4-mRNA-1 protein AED:1.00 eAED:1.00 QI:0/-1/0/0/-1/1/1/0/551